MPGILSGLRVVELAEEVAGPYVTKLLGDLGADVVKVEEPGGDPARTIGPFLGGEPGEDRSVLFLHLNTSKRSVRLDTSTEDGTRILAGLIDGAELFVTDRPPAGLADLGLAVDSLRTGSRWPSLVTLSLTPFGWTGPNRDHTATPLTTFHGAGEGYLTPVASHLMPEVVDRPPLSQGRFASEYKLATYAATLGLAARLPRPGDRSSARSSTCPSRTRLIGLNFFEFAGFLGTGRSAHPDLTGGAVRRASSVARTATCSSPSTRSTSGGPWSRLMGDPEWAQAGVGGHRRDPARSCR